MGEGADQPEAASKSWVFAFGVCLIIMTLLLLYLLLRLWPGQLPLKPWEEHSVVKLIPGLWMPDVWVEVRYLVLVAVAGEAVKKSATLFVEAAFRRATP